MKKAHLIIVCLILFVSCTSESFKLQNGDLIFQESSFSDVENSIQSVTNSIGDFNFTHIGIVYITNEGDTFVLEATPPIVKMTSLDVLVSQR